MHHNAYAGPNATLHERKNDMTVFCVMSFCAYCLVLACAQKMAHGCTRSCACCLYSFQSWHVHLHCSLKDSASKYQTAVQVHVPWLERVQTTCTWVQFDILCHGSASRSMQTGSLLQSTCRRIFILYMSGVCMCTAFFDFEVNRFWFQLLRYKGKGHWLLSSAGGGRASSIVAWLARLETFFICSSRLGSVSQGRLNHKWCWLVALSFR